MIGHGVGEIIGNRASLVFEPTHEVITGPHGIRVWSDGGSRHHIDVRHHRPTLGIESQHIDVQRQGNRMLQSQRKRTDGLAARGRYVCGDVNGQQHVDLGVDRERSLTPQQGPVLRGQDRRMIRTGEHLTHTLTR